MGSGDVCGSAGETYEMTILNLKFYVIQASLYGFMFLKLVLCTRFSGC